VKSKILKKFFKNKRVLITGNTGFVGSNLSITLSLFGAKILGYSLKKVDKGYLSNHKDYKKSIQTIFDNILNIKNYKDDIIKFKPEIIIHLASQAIVGYGYKDPKNTYLVNVMGTLELFELIKKIPSVKQILIFTSDKVYENKKGKILNENSKLGGLDPYSSSKSSQDILANSYKESFFKFTKNVIIVRAGNIIGGGDFDYSRLIPDLYSSANKNKKIILRNPNAIRPWQHIFDLIYGLLLIIIRSHKKVKTNSIIFNIGPNMKSNIKVISLIKMLKKISKNFNFKFYYKKQFKETKVLKLSNLKIKTYFKWKPNINMSETLKLTNFWYSQYYKMPNKIFKLTINQIKMYFKLV